MQHAEFMAEIDAKDRASARDREVQISTNDKAPLINKIVTPVLALGVVTLAFALFGVLLFIEVKPEAKDILIYVMGVLSAAVTQILSYYFGSSQGSKDKSDLLKEQQK
jgi:energy-converting hydrogenase Eha subunit A